MLEIARQDDTVVILCGQTIVVYYGRTPTAAASQVVIDAITHAMSRLTRAVVVIVIETRVRAPDPVARSEIQRAMQRGEAKICATGYIVLGDGFSNAAARATLSGMLLLAKPKFPTKVFATSNDAVAWLKNYDVSGPDANQLARFFAQERLTSRSAVQVH